MSMKFPVAPQSMRAVVLMICVSVTSLTGRQMVRSLGRATSTWDKSWEDDVEANSQIKNPHRQRRCWQQPHFLHHLHNKFSGFGGYLQVTSLWW